MCLVSLLVGRAQWNAIFQKSLLQGFGHIPRHMFNPCYYATLVGTSDLRTLSSPPLSLNRIYFL
jgi:hypothetical protein